MTHHKGQEENEGRAQHAAPDGNSEILRVLCDLIQKQMLRC